MPHRTYPAPQPVNGDNGDDAAHEDSQEENNDSDGYESEPPDATSALVELEPEDFPTYFSERNHRLFPLSSYTYPLPVDTPEQERLTNLTGIMFQLIGAHYIEPVTEVLASQDADGSQRRQMVLDACTGAGRWVIEMAQAFPHVHFRGFDIVPLATRYPPRNVQFELFDANVPPYRWPAGTFDLLNSRFVDMAVLDYRRFSLEAARLLRPGGLFVSCEWSRLPAFDPSMQLDPTIHAPASTRFFNAISVALAARGVRQIASHVPRILAREGLFTAITATEYYVPIGAWPADPAMRGIGLACLEAQQQFANSIRQLLLESGWAETDLNDMVADYLQEMNEVPGLVSILYTVHARRL